MNEYRGLFEKMEELGEALKTAEKKGIVRILEGRTKNRSAA
jgi:hypothetical protein